MGNYATAHITLTGGLYVGRADDAGEQVIANWDKVVERAVEIVPAFGFQQATQELAAAGVTGPVTVR